MIGMPDFIDQTGGMTRPSVSTSSVLSTLIPGTGMHTAVLFVAELQQVVVLGVEVEPFQQIAYLVVQGEYQMELSSAFCASVHEKTSL